MMMAADSATASLQAQLLALDDEALRTATDGFSLDDQALISSHWLFKARPQQLPPVLAANGLPWRVWLILAGRGFGKTRAGAEWVRGVAESDPSARIALVAGSLHEGRSVMVEGESGLLAVADPDQRPLWEVSRRRLVWPNGAQAFLYSAEDADSLRGPQHSHAWCDEFAKWPKPQEAWANLVMGLRLGSHPQTVVTTTPRALAPLKEMLGDPHTAVSRGATADNAVHLPPGFLDVLNQRWGGTRLGRQELEGALIEDVEGALWTRDWLEALRVHAAPELVRVVIGVDPSVSATGAGDACGIIVAALARSGSFYVLADATLAGASPLQWAHSVVAAAARYDADRIVAEANNGGALVAAILQQVDAAVPVELVHAARGKVARAEPVALLYEQGRVHHVGSLPDLEDELCGLCLGGRYAGPGRSPDRADALVWALAALAQPTVRPSLRAL